MNFVNAESVVQTRLFNVLLKCLRGSCKEKPVARYALPSKPVRAGGHLQAEEDRFLRRTQSPWCARRATFKPGAGRSANNMLELGDCGRVLASRRASLHLLSEGRGAELSRI